MDAEYIAGGESMKERIIDVIRKLKRITFFFCKSKFTNLDTKFIKLETFSLYNIPNQSKFEQIILFNLISF